MQPTAEASFHESSITRFEASGESLSLDLEDVVFKGEKRSASVKLKNVRQLTRDGQPIDSAQMEAENGEVLTLTLWPNRLHLIVEWNDFEAHARHTRSYACVCEELVLDVH